MVLSNLQTYGPAQMNYFVVITVDLESREFLKTWIRLWEASSEWNGNDFFYCCRLVQFLLMTAMARR